MLSRSEFQTQSGSRRVFSVEFQALSCNLQARSRSEFQAQSFKRRVSSGESQRVSRAVAVAEFQVPEFQVQRLKR